MDRHRQATIAEVKHAKDTVMPVNNYGEDDAPRFPMSQTHPDTLPYSQGKRLRYGINWAVWTVLFCIGGISAMSAGSVFSGLVGLALAGASGVYAWRIWTWQAKVFWWFFIV